MHVSRMAGVFVRWHYNQTTIDPPEVVRFIRDEHPNVIWLKPRHGNFFHRMEQKGHIPTRRIRWCCDEYKERRVSQGEVMLMGIRSEESVARAKWSAVDIHRRTNTPVVLPILDWDSEMLWEFLRDERLAVPFLYAEGFTRLGCIGCPLAGRPERRREFERWPGFRRRWQLAFRRIWAAKAGTSQRNGREWFGSALFSRWEELWEWWALGRALPNPDQMMLDFGDGKL